MRYKYGDLPVEVQDIFLRVYRFVISPGWIAYYNVSSPPKSVREWITFFYERGFHLIPEKEKELLLPYILADDV